MKKICKATTAMPLGKYTAAIAARGDNGRVAWAGWQYANHTFRLKPAGVSVNASKAESVAGVLVAMVAANPGINGHALMVMALGYDWSRFGQRSPYALNPTYDWIRGYIEGKLVAGRNGPVLATLATLATPATPDTPAKGKGK